MPRPPPAGPCTYCLVVVDVRNWDHLMPKSWYPDTTPENIERWKVPSCIPCNQSHGRNEEELLVRFMMCFGNDDARAAGIPQRVIRSMDPNQAESERDRRARADRYREVGIDMFRAPLGTVTSGLIPHFGHDEPGASDLAIRISSQSVRRLAEKIARGFVYLQKGELIGPDHRIEWFFVQDETEADRLLHPASEFNVGPGIKVRYLHTAESPVASVLSIEFWNRLKLYATVNPI